MIIQIIKDKGLQKYFYAARDIPTAPFQVLDDQSAIKAAIQNDTLQLPFAQKTRPAGYDGKGRFQGRSQAIAHRIAFDSVRSDYISMD